MKLINDFLRKRSICKFMQMAPQLIRSYGAQDQFTVPQIERVARLRGLSMQYMPYAIALYRHEASNRTRKLYRIEQDFLDTLRAEISAWFFDGYEYVIEDVARRCAAEPWRGGRETRRIPVASHFLR